MADVNRLYDALRNADAAGDVAAAKRIASYIREIQQPAQPEKLDPTEGMSGLQTTLAGVGKAMVDTGRGIGQFIPVRRNGQWDTLVTAEDVKRARELDAPLMNTTGGKVGNFIGNVAVTAPAMFIPGANTAKGAALVGSVMGALQPTETYGEKVANSMFGAAAGYGGQKVAEGAGKILGGARNTQFYNALKTTPGTASAKTTANGSLNVSLKGGGSTMGTVDPTDVGGLTSAQKAAKEAGERLGFRLTPGQASGSRSLQQMEARLESQPMTSGTFNRIKDQNQSTLNRIVARSIGEDANVVDSNVLNAAHERLGRAFKMVATDAKTTIQPDDFLGRLSQIEAEYEGLLPGSLTDNPLVTRLFKYAENGQATKRQLHDLSSKINKAALNQMTSNSGDRQVGMALYDVKDMVDDLLERGLDGKTLELFKNARREYRTLMTLMKNQGVVNASSGNVSGPILANTLNRTDRSGFMLGRNGSDLYQAAKFAQAFRPIVGDSGTATRSMPTNPMEFALSGLFNMGTGLYASSPVVNMASGISTGVAPQMFTPAMIRRLSQTGAAGTIGLLNTAQE